MVLTAVLKEQNGEVKATFRIPIELMKKLKYMAIDNNTSVNALVVKALTHLINPDNQDMESYEERKFLDKVSKEVGENLTKSKAKTRK